MITLLKMADSLQGYANDIRENIHKLFSTNEVEGLTPTQVKMIALATAYAIKDDSIVSAILSDSQIVLSDNERESVKGAVTIMAMNNTYYRFVHLATDKTFSSLQSNLQMEILSNPGIDKNDFEIMSLAVSVINNCGYCIDVHVNKLLRKNITPIAIQSSIRIAAVINALSQARFVDGFKRS